MTPTPKPVFLLAGHGIRRAGSDPMLARVVAATAASRPKAAYLGSASGDNRPFFMMMSALLRAAGCSEVKLAPTVSRRADLGRCLALLRQADLVFVSGGDVDEGMRVLTERGLIPELRALYEAGTVFCGVSAGSIMLAREWVRWSDPDDDTSASLFDCLRLADVLCDTHGEGDDWEELRAALQLSPDGTIGYGIRSGGGIAWHPGGAVEVIGGGVDVFRNHGGLVAPAGTLGT